MKSHLFPQFILKRWILSSWNNDAENNNFYTIDLYKKCYKEEKIYCDKTINNILNKNNVFYLNLDEKFAEKLEKEWEEKYEGPFFKKIYQPLLNIDKQYYNNQKLLDNKKNTSYQKEINYHIKLFNITDKKNVITNFLILNMFRSEFDKGLFKEINQYGETKIKKSSKIYYSSKFYNEEEYRQEFLRFKEEFNFENHIIFLLYVNQLIMTSPAINFYKKIFFAIPFPPFGYLCLINKKYKIFFNFENKSGDIDCSVNFEETSLDTSDFLISNEKKYDFKVMNNIFCNDFINILWLKNYGFKKGDIYLVGNSKIIERIMSNLENLNFFGRRKKYVEDKKNYDESNTIFSYVI